MTPPTGRTDFCTYSLYDPIHCIVIVIATIPTDLMPQICGSYSETGFFTACHFQLEMANMSEFLPAYAASNTCCMCGEGGVADKSVLCSLTWVLKSTVRTEIDHTKRLRMNSLRMIDSQPATCDIASGARHSSVLPRHWQLCLL